MFIPGESLLRYEGSCMDIDLNGIENANAVNNPYSTDIKICEILIIDS